MRFASGLLPSQFFQRNVIATFMTDAVGVSNLGVIGSDCLMWATDYPHDDSTWPHSQQVIEQQFGRLSERERTKLILSNVVDLYRLNAA